MTIPDEAVQAATLWAVNIHGPDDLISAPDYLSAVRMANAFNAWWLNLKTKQPHNDAIDARMWAVPTDWPGNDAQGHADELSKPHPEYQWLRELTAAAPFLTGVKVKTLEWENSNPDRNDIWACLSDDAFEINRWWEDGNSYFEVGQNANVRHDTIEAAKAAAQADYEALILSAIEAGETIETYYARQIEWSKKTFGPALRTLGILDHIRKELKEIEAEPHDLSEWIDVVILAMDGFWRHGGSVNDIMPRLLAKQQKNMARDWPDWRNMSEDSAIEHDRTKDAAPSPRAQALEEALKAMIDIGTSAFNAMHHYAQINPTTTSILDGLNTSIEAAIRALSSQPVANGHKGEWREIEISQPKALETQLAAARKALEEIDSLDQADGHELKLDDAFDAVRIARAALEAKP